MTAVISQVVTARGIHLQICVECTPRRTFYTADPFGFRFPEACFWSRDLVTTPTRKAWSAGHKTAGLKISRVTPLLEMVSLTSPSPLKRFLSLLYRSQSYSITSGRISRPPPRACPSEPSRGAGSASYVAQILGLSGESVALHPPDHGNMYIHSLPRFAR